MESVSPGESFKKVSKAIPLPAFVSDQTKEAKNGTLTKQTLGTTDIKFSMHAQLDFGSNMGWVLLGHTSSSQNVRLKVVFVYLCMLVCTHYITKAPFIYVYLYY